MGTGDDGDGTPFPPPSSHGCACQAKTSTSQSSRSGRNRPTSTSRTALSAGAPHGARPTSTPGARGAESPLVIVYGHHMSDGTMLVCFVKRI